MVDSFALFCAMGTQWNWVSVGGLAGGAIRTGLKYEGLESTARNINVDLSPSVFSDVRTLESAALGVWSKRRG
jgi:uncharacterized protein (DUF1501 family)